MRRFVFCGAIPQAEHHCTTRPGVTRHLVSMEPGLSSRDLHRPRPSNRLTLSDLERLGPVVKVSSNADGPISGIAPILLAFSV